MGLVDLHGSSGSVWVTGKWLVDHWISCVMSYQKMNGLYGLNHNTAETSGDVTNAGHTGE